MAQGIDKLVSPRQAARLLACSRRTIYRHISTGALPAIKIGRATNAPLRIPVSALTEQLVLAGPREDRE